MAGFLKISIPIKVSSELKLIPRKLQVSKLQQCFVQKKLWNSVLSELRIKSFLLINNFSFICQFSHFPSSKIIAFVFLRNFRISFFLQKFHFFAKQIFEKRVTLFAGNPNSNLPFEIDNCRNCGMEDRTVEAYG